MENKTSPDLLLNLIWLWFALQIMQPILKQHMLEQARQRWLRRLEESRNSRVIALIHRKEILNLLGFPFLQFIGIQDSEAVLRAIRMTPNQMPIDIIIHTPSGVGVAAEQIARALCRHSGKITVFVPHYALSGGTLIALAADELVMSSDAVLGAIDPMVGQFPAASILSLAERKDPSELSDSTFIALDQARKSTSQLRDTVRFLLSKRLPLENAESLARELTAGKFTQDYPIEVQELQEMGIEVKTDLPVEVFQYMAMFPQAADKRPSVDFIPVPYGNKSQV